MVHSAHSVDAVNEECRERNTLRLFELLLIKKPKHTFSLLQNSSIWSTFLSTFKWCKWCELTFILLAISQIVYVDSSIMTRKFFIRDLESQ